MNHPPSYTVVRDSKLQRIATSANEGRKFWTGPCVNDALKHLQSFPNDVCLVPYQDKKKVMLGGPIPAGTLLDVTGENFALFADSFDVGEMSELTKEWFQNTFDQQVVVHILENGEMAVIGPNSKLICLARQTPALLDMATTEDGVNIGQYNNTILSHSGDMNSVIGDVACLHHETALKPTRGTKLYILAGYSSKPLKAWRDSRVFWMVYDRDSSMCWLVPHNLSHDAVGNTVSATMPLVSKSNEDGSVSVFHLSTPVQASLASASPIRSRDNASHREFLDRCMASASSIGSSPNVHVHYPQPKTEDVANAAPQVPTALPTVDDKANAVDRCVALYDRCTDTLFDSYPVKHVVDKGASISTRHGPLKILARGCCARSRVVVVDATEIAATSEINSVATQLSGVILVKMDHSDIYKDLHMVRWNTSRGMRTPVLALTPEGCRHLCGVLPPQIEIEDYPTPVAGTPIPTEAVKSLIEYALSPESDDYFGPLYQPVPSFTETESAIRCWMDDMARKDFRAVLSDEQANIENAFDDEDFRRLMEVINILSISSASAVERNCLAIKVAKFLRAQAKKVAEHELKDSSSFQKSIANLELLKGWCGDNMDWAVSVKDVLEDMLKEFSIKVEPEEGLVDIAMQSKLDDAIQRKKSGLAQSIRATKQGSHGMCKKVFNAVFGPALEALMRSTGDNPRYKNYFHDVKNPNVSGIIIHASQSSNKQSVMNSPEDVMKVYHQLGATGFISFKVNFLQSWRSKVINQICIVDEPGKGFNDPKSFVPVDHRIEDGPGDPMSAYETDIRHQFVLPIFPRLPKFTEDEDSEDEEDDEALKQMPNPSPDENLAEYLLMRSEFVLRDPEQGTRHPLWRYADWLFDRIKTVHQLAEAQAAPLVVRALGYSILQIMEKPGPDRKTMETVVSIIQAMNFISARGAPMPHAAIDTFFNMDSTYVPLSKELERNPWQIDVVNILSRAVDFVRPLMSAEEYGQIRSNFQRAAANTVKRQIVQKLLDHMKQELKKNKESHEDYVARINSEFYPAYRDVVDTIGILLDADPTSFQLTDDLCDRIDSLYNTIVIDWAKRMRRCRVGPVREMASALMAFRKKGPEAMAYLVSRKPYLQRLYDQVFHIKYESCDHALVEEMCKIIRAKGRNPEHTNHQKWNDRVDNAIHDVSCYDKMMTGFAHGNNFKRLPTGLMLEMLHALRNHPGSNESVTFSQVRELLAHVNITVTDVGDLHVQPDNADGRTPVLDQLRGAWWMCADTENTDKNRTSTDSIPNVALIPMGVPASSNIMAILGDTYHKFELARLFSGNLGAMRSFVRENYKFHLGWFEDTIRAAGLPKHFDSQIVQDHELLAIYAVVQRLVHELVQDESDRGDRVRDVVYGEVMDPLSIGNDEPGNHVQTSAIGLLKNGESGPKAD